MPIHARSPSHICPFPALALAVALSTPACSQRVAPQAATPTTPHAATTAFALRLMEEHGLPGLSIAVGVGDTIVYSEGFGHADIENRVPVTTLTRFRIGSVSKPVTSFALGVLHEAGKLDFDAPVQRYVPTFPRKRWPISTRQVAGHIAGIRHYLGMENLSMRRFPTVRAGLDIFQADSLMFEPGTRYAYSSYGWNLVSAVVEGAAGEPFLAYMRRAVFEPLGMRSIIAEHTDSIIHERARFYQRAADDRLLNAPYVDNSYKWAGGGFISNAEDLVRFGFGVLNGAVIDRSTAELLFASQKLRDGEDTDYGMGWSSGRDAAGRRVIGHTGGSVGGRAVLVLFPDRNTVVAMLSNAGHAPMSTANAGTIAAWFMEN